VGQRAGLEYELESGRQSEALPGPFRNQKAECILAPAVEFLDRMYGRNKHNLTEHLLVELVDTDPKMIKWLEKQKEAKEAEAEKAKTGQTASHRPANRNSKNQHLFRMSSNRWQRRFLPRR